MERKRICRDQEIDEARGNLKIVYHAARRAINGKLPVERCDVSPKPSAAVPSKEMRTGGPPSFGDTCGVNGLQESFGGLLRSRKKYKPEGDWIAECIPQAKGGVQRKECCSQKSEVKDQKSGIRDQNRNRIAMLWFLSARRNQFEEVDKP